MAAHATYKQPATAVRATACMEQIWKTEASFGRAGRAPMGREIGGDTATPRLPFVSAGRGCYNAMG